MELQANTLIADYSAGNQLVGAVYLIYCHSRLPHKAVVVFAYDASAVLDRKHESILIFLLKWSPSDTCYKNIFKEQS